MPSSGMLLRVVLVRTDVSEELSASIISVSRIDELGTLALTSNRRTMRRNTASVLPSSPILVIIIIIIIITELQMGCPPGGSVNTI
jgi:hypothetical protein